MKYSVQKCNGEFQVVDKKGKVYQSNIKTVDQAMFEVEALQDAHTEKMWNRLLSVAVILAIGYTVVAISLGW